METSDLLQGESAVQTAAPQTADATPTQAAPEVKVQPAQYGAPLPPLGAKRGITGTQLKIIAIVTMAIDHIGAIAMIPLIMAYPQSALVIGATTLMRCIGRLAFPIFCFLLVQGFLHTSNVKRYALRLAAFALISEVPFDLALNGVVLEFTYQNVFFTLLCGLLAIWAIDALRGKVALQILAAVACAGAAQLLRTDYSAMGVVVIILFYVLREHKTAMFVSVGVWLWLGMALLLLPDYLQFVGAYPIMMIVASMAIGGLNEALGAFSFLFIARYNGQRGAKMPKYLFYAFYPGHILLLAGVAWLLTYFLA